VRWFCGVIVTQLQRKRFTITNKPLGCWCIVSYEMAPLQQPCALLVTPWTAAQRPQPPAQKLVLNLQIIKQPVEKWDSQKPVAISWHHYATRRGCRVLILIAWKCVGCDTMCCRPTLTKLYLTYSMKLQRICSSLLMLCVQLQLEAISTNYTCIIVLFM